MIKHSLVVGTRGSALALWQTEYVIKQIRAFHPDLEVKARIIQTQGDVVRDRALSQAGGTGLFVAEIEQALLAGRIDLAVHSLKDLPTEQPAGLVLGAILERADPRDALVVRGGEGTLADLPAGARLGTSSLRRRAQIMALRPDLQVIDMRGNVDTRLRKLREGQYEAAVLAAAGLNRLGRAGEISQLLPLEVMLPAVGQGALCVEVQSDDEAARELIAVLDHQPTRQATEAERAFLRRLGGGCQVPIAAYADVGDGLLHLSGLIAACDGTRLVRDDLGGSSTAAVQLGTELAERLLSGDGGDILEEIRRAI